MALQRVGGQYQVLLRVADPALPEGATVAVPVEVGLSDGVNTQITSGLQPGDQVVVQVEAAQTTNPFAPPGNPGTPGGQNSLTNIIRQFTRAGRPTGRWPRIRRPRLPIAASTEGSTHAKTTHGAARST